MIRIKKTAKPEILVANAEKWTKEYCCCLAHGKKPRDSLSTAYNHPLIKKALEDETYGKCAYCESKITHIDFGDIEHILPKHKGARPELCFEWSNLTLACSICNRSGKGTYYDEECPLINPYTDYPESYFTALGWIIRASEGDIRADVTEEKLKLNRRGLIERRKDRIKSIENLLKLWAITDSSNPDKLLYENMLHKQYYNDKEYSFVVKEHLKAKNFPVKNKFV